MGFVVLTLLSQLLWLISLAGSQVPEVDPGRVQVREMHRGKTVCGAQGELLRGATVAVYKFRRETIGQPGYPATDYATDPAFWDQMKANGVNAVRVVFFDGWQRSHGDPILDRFKPFPFASLTISDALLQGAASQAEAEQIVRQDGRAIFEDFDTIVDLASERSMYLLINYHDTTGYRDPDFAAGIPDGSNQFAYSESVEYLYRFWNRIAPRYANRTHVFYELMNEPVGYHPNDYTNRDIWQVARLYRHVRRFAPDTHLVLGTFTTTQTFVPGKDMNRVARQLGIRGVDFRNASIGFHPYDISDLPHTLNSTARLMRTYPVINTEQGLPAALTTDPNGINAPGFGNLLLGSHSMERMRISWFAWNTFESEGFQDVFVGIVKADATRKRYFWDVELMLSEGLTRLEFSDPISYALAKPMFDLYTNGPEPPSETE